MQPGLCRMGEQLPLFIPRFPRKGAPCWTGRAQRLLTTSRGWQTAQRPHLQVLLAEHEIQMQSSEEPGILVPIVVDTPWHQPDPFYLSSLLRKTD